MTCSAAGTSLAGESEGSALDCIICFTRYDRVFKVPKALACGHTFCLECLARLSVAATAATTLLCPVCRRPTALPRRRGLPALPTRSDLLALLPADVPAAPGSVRFSRPRGLLYVAAPSLKPDQVPTVTLSLEVGQPQPPSPPRRRGWPWPSRRRPLCKAAALACSLVVVGGLALCSVFLFFLLPAACGAGVPAANSTCQGQPWGPLYDEPDATVTPPAEGDARAAEAAGGGWFSGVMVALRGPAPLQP
ncbi:RING finger protein 225-like [Apteryx rowi]|uniref:RING finger protein 225-like n=1 Tax=Apteryx rowi TaxID=308060 RepID=UPI000E1DDB24|nr:RING finger protein 225-like [Apteryx rowi]